MSQGRTITSLADVPMSASARQQFAHYLSSIPAYSSASSSKPSSSDLDALLQRSTNLTNRVDALHAQLSDSPSNGNQDNPELFWTTLTLLTNLRELSAQLQRSSAGDRRVGEAQARTQQNVGIVESLLRLISVSSSEEEGNAFTAPVKPVVAQTAREGNWVGDGKGYEYWKQQTLSALDLDSADDTSASDDDAASDADSILTDPNIHLQPTSIKSTSTPLAGIKRDEDEDLSEYDRALHSKPPPPTAPTTTTGSDTILQSDRSQHEALSSELLRMASILKSNSLAFADSLERDRILLEKASTDLSSNLSLMTRTRGRLGVYSKKARSMGWFTLSAILVVIVSWMLMFLLIRLT